MRTPKRPNVSNNVLEDADDDQPVAPRNSRGSKTRVAAKPARNSRTAVKPSRTEKPAPAKSASKGKTANRNSRERAATNNSRDNEDRGSKNFTETTIEFEYERETKNKVVYRELDENGDAYEEFRGGIFGNPIYWPKNLAGRKPPQRIKVTIEEAD